MPLSGSWGVSGKVLRLKQSPKCCAQDPTKFVTCSDREVSLESSSAQVWRTRELSGMPSLPHQNGNMHETTLKNYHLRGHSLSIRTLGDINNGFHNVPVALSVFPLVSLLPTCNTSGSIKAHDIHLTSSEGQTQGILNLPIPLSPHVILFIPATHINVVLQYVLGFSFPLFSWV